MTRSTLMPGNLARLEFALVMPGGRRIEIKQDGVLTNENTMMDRDGNISTQIEGVLPEGEFSLEVTDGPRGRMRWRLSVDTMVTEAVMTQRIEPPVRRSPPPPTTTPAPPAPAPTPERGEEAREL